MSAASRASGASTGGAHRRSAASPGKGGPSRPDAELPEAGRVEVTLEHSRWRHLGWGVFCLALGSALILKLGTVGKLIGLVLLLVAAWRGLWFVRTLVNPAGTFVIDGDRVVLPHGLCRRGETTLTPGEVKHAFLLRRAVPWTRAAPLLVIEIEDRVQTYPRDWFASESQQHQIAKAIGAHQGSRPAAQ